MAEQKIASYHQFLAERFRENDAENPNSLNAYLSWLDANLPRFKAKGVVTDIPGGLGLIIENPATAQLETVYLNPAPRAKPIGVKTLQIISPNNNG